MYILEDYLSNARKKLEDLEKQLDAFTQKKDAELERKQQHRGAAYRDQGEDAAFNKEVEKEKTRYAEKIERVKSEIADLEKQIASEDYQLLKRAHLTLDPIRQQAWIQWPDRRTEQEFHTLWIQLQKDALREKAKEAIKKGGRETLMAIERRLRYYWLDLGGTEEEFNTQWSRWQKDAFREMVLDDIQQRIERIFSK